MVQTLEHPYNGIAFVGALPAGGMGAFLDAPARGIERVRIELDPRVVMPVGTTAIPAAVQTALLEIADGAANPTGATYPVEVQIEWALNGFRWPVTATTDRRPFVSDLTTFFGALDDLLGGHAATWGFSLLKSPKAGQLTQNNNDPALTAELNVTWGPSNRILAWRWWEEVSQQVVDYLRTTKLFTKNIAVAVMDDHDIAESQVAQYHPAPWIVDPEGKTYYEAHVFAGAAVDRSFADMVTSFTNLGYSSMTETFYPTLTDVGTVIGPDALAVPTQDVLPPDPSADPDAAPSAPTITQVVASDGMARVFWTAPTFAGTYGVTKYRARAWTTDVDGNVFEAGSSDVLGDVTEVTIGPLVNDVEHSFSVTAFSNMLESADSSVLTATPSEGLPPVEAPPEKPPPPVIPEPVKPAPVIAPLENRSVFAPVQTALSADHAGHVERLMLVETYHDVVTDTTKVLDSFEITPSFGAVWYTALDLGYPEVRDASTPYPDVSGTYDQTALHGPRSVSLGLLVLGDSYAPRDARNWSSDVDWNSADYWVSRLGGWMDPAKRIRLIYRMRRQGRSLEEEAGHRWVELRAAASSVPIEMEDREGRAVQLQWVNPSGKIREFGYRDGPSWRAGARLTEDRRYQAEVTAGGTSNPGDMVGREYPEAFPRGYGAGVEPTIGAGVLVYEGTVKTGLNIRVSADGGAVVNPVIEVVGPDRVVQKVALNYTLADGAFFVADTERRIIALSGRFDDETQYLNKHLVAPLNWPELKPGVNGLGATATERQPGFHAVDITHDGAGAAAVTCLWSNAHLV